MHRRKFIQTSATATTALLLSSLESIAADKPVFMQNKNFEMKVLATNWGFAGSTDDFCKKAKAEAMMVSRSGGRWKKQVRTACSPH
jgi:hypothetical protein